MSHREDILSVIGNLFEPQILNSMGSETLNNKLSWTSLDVIEFIAVCDEQFNVTLSPADILKTETVLDLVHLVEQNTSNTVQ